MNKHFSVNINIVIYAFRHALGNSYPIASDCAIWIQALWPELPEDAKDQIRREIRVIIERSQAGDPNCVLLWDNIAKL